MKLKKNKLKHKLLAHFMISFMMHKLLIMLSLGLWTSCSKAPESETVIHSNPSVASEEWKELETAINRLGLNPEDMDRSVEEAESLFNRLQKLRSRQNEAKTFDSQFLDVQMQYLLVSRFDDFSRRMGCQIMENLWLDSIRGKNVEKGAGAGIELLQRVAEIKWEEVIQDEGSTEKILPIFDMIEDLKKEVWSLSSVLTRLSPFEACALRINPDFISADFHSLWLRNHDDASVELFAEYWLKDRICGGDRADVLKAIILYRDEVLVNSVLFKLLSEKSPLDDDIISSVAKRVANRDAREIVLWIQRISSGNFTNALVDEWESSKQWKKSLEVLTILHAYPGLSDHEFKRGDFVEFTARVCTMLEDFNVESPQSLVLQNQMNEIVNDAPKDSSVMYAYYLAVDGDSRLEYLREKRLKFLRNRGSETFDPFVPDYFNLDGLIAHVRHGVPLSNMAAEFFVETYDQALELSGDTVASLPVSAYHSILAYLLRASDHPDLLDRLSEISGSHFSNKPESIQIHASLLDPQALEFLENSPNLSGIHFLVLMSHLIPAALPSSDEWVEWRDLCEQAVQRAELALNCPVESSEVGRMQKYFGVSVGTDLLMNKGNSGIPIYQSTGEFVSFVEAYWRDEESEFIDFYPELYSDPDILDNTQRRILKNYLLRPPFSLQSESLPVILEALLTARDFESLATVLNRLNTEVLAELNASDTAWLLLAADALQKDGASIVEISHLIDPEKIAERFVNYD